MLSSQCACSVSHVSAQKQKDQFPKPTHICHRSEMYVSGFITVLCQTHPPAHTYSIRAHRCTLIHTVSCKKIIELCQRCRVIFWIRGQMFVFWVCSERLSRHIIYSWPVYWIIEWLSARHRVCNLLCVCVTAEIRPNLYHLYRESELVFEMSGNNVESWVMASVGTWWDPIMNQLYWLMGL